MPQLQVKESPQEQASDEVIAWSFDWTDRLNSQSVSSATAKVIDLATDSDVSSTCIQGTPVVDASTVTVTVQSLTARKRYRLTVTAVLSGGTTQDADLLIDTPH